MTYTINRSKRKTTRISIKNGIVSIKAPLKAKDDDIDRFVRSKSDWIQKHLSQHENCAIDPRVAQYQGILLSGHFVKVEYKPNTLTKLNDGILNINDKHKATPKKQIVKFMVKVASQSLVAELDRVAKIIGVEYSKFSLSYAKTKWGSCDNNNQIMLNYRLVSLPRHLMLFVIVHELCHTTHHNHSAAFWQLVSQFCPAHKQYKQELKKWSSLNNIY